MVQLLLGVNLIVYGLCYAQSGTGEIADDILLRYGAMSTGAIGECLRMAFCMQTPFISPPTCSC
jgi:hypothetical protein